MRFDHIEQTTEGQNEILSSLFNEKYELRLGEFNNTTGMEKINTSHSHHACYQVKLKV